MTTTTARVGDGTTVPIVAPIRLLDIDLNQPLQSITPARGKDGAVYRRAQVLVRLHRRPVGRVDLLLDADGSLPAERLAAAIWQALGATIGKHLDSDGARTPAELPVDGLPSGPCRQEPAICDPPLVSIVIPTRNRSRHLVGCVDSLLRLDYPLVEILIVDNAPATPATAELIEERYGHLGQVQYLREDRPGSSIARNTGLAAARGDIVAFTDDDAVADPAWLTGLVNGFTLAADVTCVTGPVLPAELETQAQVWFEQYGGFDRGYERRRYDLTEHRGSSPFYPYVAGIFGSGNNMAFRTAKLRAMGGFDPALGAGSPVRAGADIEAFLRVVLSGETLVYEPAAIVRHHHRRDYAGLRRQVHDYGVGITAILTRYLLSDPACRRTLLTRAPTGIAIMFGPRSVKNAKKDGTYPTDLFLQELKGMMLGPFIYARSVSRLAPLRQVKPGRRLRPRREEEPSA
jgi:glycosyltransferase involved in cell wall biosynthesis